MNIADFCMRRATVTLSLATALFIAGVLAYFKLGRLEDPEFTIRCAQIVVSYPGATAQEVAESVADPLETEVQRLGKVRHVTSKSYPGHTVISVEIEDKYAKDELPQIWDELRRKVNDYAPNLPLGCSPPQVVDDYGDVYGVLYAIYGDGFTSAQLYDHAKMLRRELLMCEDVSKVDLLGVVHEIVLLEISRAKLASLGITPEQLAAVVQGQNTPADAGHMRIGDKYVRLYPSATLSAIDDFKNLVLPVTRSDGQVESIYLGDIVTVRRDYEDPPSLVVHYDGKPALALGISTVKGGNVIRMGNSVQKRMRELLPETPIGIEMGVISHQATSVETAVNGFVVNLIESVIIVIAVLLITMGLRSGLLIGGVLLLVVMSTVAVMQAVGILFERISLGAFIIALGMLVDNAIVITESVLVAAKRGENCREAACAVVKQTIWPLLGATVVAILSFAPIGASRDSTGEFCRSLFLVIAISLLLSWIYAITVTPLLASRILSKTRSDLVEIEKDPYSGFFFKIYKAFLVWCVKNRGFTWFALGCLVVASVFGARHIKQNFFPNSTRPQFMVHVWMPEGTSIHATNARVQTLTDEIKKLKNVTGVSSVTGGGALRFLLTYSPEENDFAYAVLFVDVTSDKAVSDLMTQIEKIGPDLVPDAEVSCQRFVLGPGEAYKIQYRILGQDPARLRELGEKALAILRADGHLKAVQSNWRNRAELIRPKLSEQRARKMGITRMDVARGLKAATEGISVGVLLEGDEHLPIVLRVPEEDRNNPDSILSSWILGARSGCAVPYAQIVDDIEQSSEEMILERRDRQFCLTVQCNPFDDETADEALGRIKPKLDELAQTFPVGYRGEWGGEYENSADANRAIGGKLPMILMLMVLIVVMLFNSLRQTLVIFMTLPLIIIGVVAGLLVFRESFGFMALLGFLSLIGMQVKNAIVLIDEINARLAAGDTPYQAVISAGVSRVRPVANSSLTTVLGMLPLMADAFYSAMAVTIMMGLTFATILTLIIIPVNYALVYRVKCEN